MKFHLNSPYLFSVNEILYHNPGIKPMILQILQAYMKNNEYGGS